MSNTNSGGCGCLALLGIIVIATIYPIYDGYISREVDKDQRAKITFGEPVFIYKGLDRPYLFVGISNDSDWILSKVTATLTYTSEDGATHELIGMTDKINDAEKFEIIPGATIQTPIFFGPEAGKSLIQVNVTRWSWRVTQVQAHRRPIKLVKRPVDFLMGLFERS